MSLIARTSKGKCRAKIDGDMTIYTACELRDKLLKKLANCQSMTLDLSQVAEFDTAGFQVLAALRQEAGNNDKQLILKSHSPAVRDVFELYRVNEQVERKTASYHNARTPIGEQLS